MNICIYICVWMYVHILSVLSFLSLLSLLPIMPIIHIIPIIPNIHIILVPRVPMSGSRGEPKISQTLACFVKIVCMERLENEVFTEI